MGPHGGWFFPRPCFKSCWSGVAPRTPIYLAMQGRHGVGVIGQLVKNLLAVWETQAQALGWEDSLEEGMATHSSILAWRIPWTEEPGGLQSMDSQ